MEAQARQAGRSRLTGWGAPKGGLTGAAPGIVGGLTGWLLARLQGKSRPRPQLAVLERITLAPRQSLTLIEASGHRLLVATSADGTPAFYAVGGRERPTAAPGPERVSRRRVSW